MRIAGGSNVAHGIRSVQGGIGLPADEALRAETLVAGHNRTVFALSLNATVTTTTVDSIITAINNGRIHYDDDTLTITRPLLAWAFKRQIDNNRCVCVRVRASRVC